MSFYCVVRKEYDHYYNKHHKGSARRFAAHMYKKMSPRRKPIKAKEDDEMDLDLKGPPSSRDSIAMRIAATRSKFRKEFCERIVKRAPILGDEIANDKAWKNIFKTDYEEMKNHGLFLKYLLKPL